MISTCKCGQKMLEPIGPRDSSWLIIGGEPDDEDMKLGMPFTGKRGNVLYRELALVGLQIQKARITYVNRHQYHKEDNCAGHFSDVLHELKEKDGVLLIGAEAACYFGVEDLSDRVGLCVENVYIPKSTGFVMVTTNPPTNDFIGEFRLSLEKFSRKLKEVQRAS